MNNLYDGVLLKQEKVVKFFGVFIDEHLTWKPHITYFCKKISKSIGLMFRSRFLLSVTTKKFLYYTLIYPYLTYCTTVWSSTYVTHLNRIFLLQKSLDIYIALIRSMLHNLCFHIIINYCYRFFFLSIFLLLVAIFIIITLELLRIFVLMPAEPIPNNLLSWFKAQNFGILYQTQ